MCNQILDYFLFLVEEFDNLNNQNDDKGIPKFESNLFLIKC